MRSLSVSLLLLLPLHAVTAQWRLTLLHGSASASGYSRDEGGTDHLAFLPDRPSSNVIVIGPGTAIVTRRAMHAWGAAIEGTRRLVGAAGRPTLHAGLGLLVERWAFDLEANDARWRVAGRGAIEVGVPVTERWTGIVRGEVTVSPSVFSADELPEGYLRRMGWRRGLGLGAGWRF